MEDRKGIIADPRTGEGDCRVYPSAEEFDPFAHEKQGCPPRRKPIARTLLAEVTLVIGLSDEDGEPQGPYNGQKVTVARLDREGRGRDLVEQFRELLAKAEGQVVQMWEKPNAAA